MSHHNFAEDYMAAVFAIVIAAGNETIFYVMIISEEKLQEAYQAIRSNYTRNRRNETFVSCIEIE